MKRILNFVLISLFLLGVNLGQAQMRAKDAPPPAPVARIVIIDTIYDEFYKTTMYVIKNDFIFAGGEESINLSPIAYKDKSWHYMINLYHIGNKPLDILSLGTVSLVMLVDGKLITLKRAISSKSEMDISADSPLYTEMILYKVNYSILRKLSNAKDVKVRAQGNNIIEANFKFSNIEVFKNFIERFPSR